MFSCSVCLSHYEDDLYVQGGLKNLYQEEHNFVMKSEVVTNALQ